MDGWERIIELNRGFGVFSGEGDKGGSTPIAIFREQSHAEAYVGWLRELKEAEQPMEPHLVLEMRQSQGEFWNSCGPVDWDAPLSQDD